MSGNDKYYDGNKDFLSFTKLKCLTRQFRRMSRAAKKHNLVTFFLGSSSFNNLYVSPMGTNGSSVVVGWGSLNWFSFFFLIGDRITLMHDLPRF